MLQNLTNLDILSQSFPKTCVTVLFITLFAAINEWSPVGLASVCICSLQDISEDDSISC